MRLSERVVAVVALVSILVPVLVAIFGWQMLVSYVTAPQTPPPTTTPQVAGAQATSTPVARTAQPTSRPTAGATPTVQPTTSTPQPTAVVAVSAVQVTVTPASGAAGGSDPSDAVATFYSLVASHQFDAAAQLWTPRMRGNFPPQINLNERFAQTQTIQLQRDEVISQSGSQAVVAVDLVESNAQSGRRHYVGNWYLVRTEAGWLLDQPQLQAIP